MQSGFHVTEVLLFHHAQGQTSGFLAFADELRRAGHTVHMPDLYDGRTFSSLDEGVAYAESIGFETIIERGVAAAALFPAELVYIGFSLGVLPAQKLAQTRPGARGAVLIHSCVPIEMFSPSWPDEVPVRMHAMEDDPLFVDDGDFDAARDLLASADDATLSLYVGDQHLFADNSLPSYDETAASSLMQDVLEFLASIDSDLSA